MVKRPIGGSFKALSVWMCRRTRLLRNSEYFAMEVVLPIGVDCIAFRRWASPLRPRLDDQETKVTPTKASLGSERDGCASQLGARGITNSITRISRRG